nr:hypothetical protein [Candidatus Peribacteraceae bacterium]
MTDQNDTKAEKQQRMADVAALVERRQEDVRVEEQRQADRLLTLEQVTKQEEAQLKQELALIEQKREVSSAWRAEQKEKKRALAADRLRKQQALEHEMKLKAEAQAEREKRQAYMDAVHRIAAQKRLKAARVAALREEELTNDDTEHREHAANVTSTIQHDMAIREIGHRAESRRKELQTQFRKRRLELDQWAQRQMAQITGLQGPLSTRDRLTPDQRRRVQMVEQERDRNLETMMVEEKQQAQALEAGLVRERAAADKLFRDRTDVTARARSQSDAASAAHRDDTINRAVIRAESFSVTGHKETTAEKDKAAKD